MPSPQLVPRYRGLAPFLIYPVRVKGAFLVVSWHAGILWVVKDGASSPGRAIRLVGLTEGHLAGRVPHPDALLEIQPLPNGHVLVAMRSEAAILAPGKDPGELVWKDVDPMEGTVMEADPALTSAYPTTKVAGFRFFTFTSDGQLVVRKPAR